MKPEPIPIRFSAFRTSIILGPPLHVTTKKSPPPLKDLSAILFQFLYPFFLPPSFSSHTFFPPLERLRCSHFDHPLPSQQFTISLPFRPKSCPHQVSFLPQWIAKETSSFQFLPAVAARLLPILLPILVDFFSRRRSSRSRLSASIVHPG